MIKSDLFQIVYTGKEGKTTAGCPLAKWIIRRGSLDEKILMIVKNRKGHTCSTAWIVVVVVAWEGVASQEADSIYSLLTTKLNKLVLIFFQKTIVTFFTDYEINFLMLIWFAILL